MAQDPAGASALITSWLSARIAEADRVWLEERAAAIAAEADDKRQERLFFTGFSAAGRRAPREPLNLTAEERAAAEACRAGWRPGAWTGEQAARALMVLSWPAADPGALTTVLDKTFQSADMRELVALYQTLPLLPFPEAHAARAAEGVRTNITSVFCAVAHDNPYAKERFGEGAWNQMVLKALFVGVPLAPIDGLDERANPALSAMLRDYAHERWAAGRRVSPELWRCVALCADDAALADLERALNGEDLIGARGAALALASCPHPGAAALLTGREAENASWAELAAEAASQEQS